MSACTTCCILIASPRLLIMPKKAFAEACAHLRVDTDLLCAAAAGGFMCHATEGSKAVVQHA
jgi:hypothetical protein